MHSSHTADLIIPFLPPEAGKAHIFPALTSGSLISIGQLCDYGCTAIFTDKTVDILRHGISVLKGSRSPTTKLWSIDLEAAQTLTSNVSNASIGSQQATAQCRYHAEGRCMFGAKCRFVHNKTSWHVSPTRYIQRPTLQTASHSIMHPWDRLLCQPGATQSMPVASQHFPN